MQLLFKIEVRSTYSEIYCYRVYILKNFGKESKSATSKRQNKTFQSSRKFPHGSFSQLRSSLNMMPPPQPDLVLSIPKCYNMGLHSIHSLVSSHMHVAHL